MRSCHRLFDTQSEVGPLLQAIERWSSLDRWFSSRPSYEARVHVMLGCDQMDIQWIGLSPPLLQRSE